VSYQVFARKYRPQTFADVLGQDHVVRTLSNAIAQNRLAHAYLFVGPRGTGKTSTARIFAKALNCKNGPSIEFDPDDDICQEIAEGRSLDVLEIDGASNNGVDEVRDLREKVRYSPARCRFKIYYIDEVHMLSTAAFNALLKTLEEPPPHVKFIFATTEANKILPTIISRCQRFDLRRIPNTIIAKHLLHIADLENVQLDEKAAYAIAKGADGGMRDAQSMLDQLVAFCGGQIKEENVLEIFGFTSAEAVATLAQTILSQDTVGSLRVVHQQNDAGKDLGTFARGSDPAFPHAAGVSSRP
jgi:DNA polymerase-3 subunit gamma/tau